tara:strand:- start:613 stop:1362 length:750 start_codon:yes stop_codon:yes gene_type:complete
MDIVSINTRNIISTNETTMIIKERFNAGVNNLDINLPDYDEAVLSLKKKMFNEIHEYLIFESNYYLSANFYNRMMYIIQETSEITNDMDDSDTYIDDNMTFILLNMKSICYLNDINIDITYDISINTSFNRDLQNYEIVNKYVPYFVYSNMDEFPTYDDLSPILNNDSSTYHIIIIDVIQNQYNIDYFNIKYSVFRKFYLVTYNPELEQSINNIDFIEILPYYIFSPFHIEETRLLLFDIIHEQYLQKK